VHDDEDVHAGCLDEVAVATITDELKAEFREARERIADLERQVAEQIDAKMGVAGQWANMRVDRHLYRDALRRIRADLIEVQAEREPLDLLRMLDSIARVLDNDGRYESAEAHRIRAVLSDLERIAGERDGPYSMQAAYASGLTTAVARIREALGDSVVPAVNIRAEWGVEQTLPGGKPEVSRVCADFPWSLAAARLNGRFGAARLVRRTVTCTPWEPDPDGEAVVRAGGRPDA